MWKTRVRWLGLFLAAAFLTAALANAQTVKKETADFLMTGEIIAIDTTAKTLTLKAANGESGQKGARVALNGDNPGDKKIATYIEVVEGPAKK